MNSADKISFNYKFIFEDNSQKVFDIQLNPDTLDLIHADELEKPEWATFKNFDCPIKCNLAEKCTYCPIAVNLNSVIKNFSTMPSFEKVKVIVETNERIYSKDTSLQSAIGSMLGIIMSTSGCPILGKLKPLAKFHLPFSTMEETDFRVFGMYLIAQFLSMKNNGAPDWQMNNLKFLYEDIQKINRHIANKISALEKLDASLNSIIVLNNFAFSISFGLEENLANLEKLFSSWLK